MSGVVNTLSLQGPDIDINLDAFSRDELAALAEQLDTAAGRNAMRLQFMEGEGDADDAARAVRALRIHVRRRLCH